MGLYVFEPRVLQYIPQGQHLDFPDLVKKLLTAGERVIGYPYAGYWQDLGNPTDYDPSRQRLRFLKTSILPKRK